MLTSSLMNCPGVMLNPIGFCSVTVPSSWAPPWPRAQDPSRCCHNLRAKPAWVAEERSATHTVKMGGVPFGNGISMVIKRDIT